MELLTPFTHGSIQFRAESMHKHRFNLVAIHTVLRTFLAGQVEILEASIDQTSTTYQRILNAGHQVITATVPPAGIQELAGIADQAHQTGVLLIMSEANGSNAFTSRS